MSALFETVEAPESNVIRRADVEGTYFGGEGVVNYVLSPRDERRAQIIETHIAPGGSPGPEPWSHAGELVMASVIEGTVEFRFGDEQDDTEGRRHDLVLAGRAALVAQS